MLNSRFFVLKAFMIVSLFLQLGCVNGGDSNASVGPVRVEYPYAPIRMSPSIQYVLPSQQVKIFPEGGSGKYAYSIYQGLGVVNAAGYFTAPVTSGTTQIRIADDAGGQGFGTIVTLNPLALTPANSFVTISQQRQFTASGGLPPYTYSILDAGKGTINAATGLLTAPPVIGVTLVRVQDSLGNQTQVNVRYLEPLVVTPASGFFPSNGNLQLTRAGGEGLLTYQFQQGSGLVVVDPITNTLIPNEGASGRVQLKITDAVGYSTVITLDFFNPRKVAIGKSHACAVNSDRQLYCWGGNDRGQIGDAMYGPIIGDDPLEMGDALLAVTGYTGVVDISVQDHSTCMIHTVGGNRQLKCWGAGDDVETTEHSNTWPGTWAEQNQRYGTGGNYGHFTRNYSEFWKGIGSASSSGNFWSVRSHVGDTLAHPLSSSTSARLLSDQTGGTNYLDKLLGIENAGQSVCFSTTNGKVSCSNQKYFPHLGLSSGASHYNSGTSQLMDIVTTRGSADGSKNQTLSKMGTILKYSASSSASIMCYVIHVTASLKTTPVNYSLLYSGKKRIICMHSYYNRSNGAALEGGPDFNNIIESIPRPSDYAQSSYFSAGFDHPEFANIFDTSNATSTNELEALDVAASANSNDTFTVCGLFENGATNIVKCWGNNQFGALGKGSLSPSEVLVPADYPTLSFGTNENPIALYTTGNSSFCAKTYNSVTGYKNLYCWGRNDYGQLGLPATPQISAPVQVDFSMQQGMGYEIEEVKTATYTMCARFSHSTQPHQLYCWGRNWNAILGAGLDPVEVDYYGPSPVQLSSVTPFSVKAFDIGDGHGCAVDTTDKIKCWGGREFGKLGAYRAYIHGDEPQEVGTGLNKVNVNSGRTFYHVFAGYKHTCAIMSGNEEGELICFGANGDRQLGRGESGPKYLDVGAHHLQKVDDDFAIDRDTLDNLAGAGSKVVKVVGHFGMFALTDTGVLFSWGNNNSNSLGRGGIGVAASSPGKLTNVGVVKDVTSSTYHINGAVEGFACLVLENLTGDVHCWGNNSNRALGKLGGNYTSAVNTNVTSSANLTKVSLGSFKAVGISSGLRHVCALSDLGKVKCWGDNAVGQLGIGVTPNNAGSGNGPIPLNSDGEMGDNLREVNLGTDVAGSPYIVKQLTSGDNHNCALFTDGRAKCWGDNSFGQLGLGTTDTVGAIDGQMGNNLGFVNVGPGATIIQITAGGDSTCAVLSNNDVKCWGDNMTAQLGVGDKKERGTSALNTGTNLQKVEFP